MITPGGVICIACGPGDPGYLGGTVIRVLGVIFNRNSASPD